MIKTLKSIIKNVCFLLILLKIGLLSAQPYPSKKIVVIDPGHGGIDPGAIGLHNSEKDITLHIALELIKWNSILLKKELDIYLTRYSDTLISLSDRSLIAKKLKAEIFISIHCNASYRNAKGIEVFITKRKDVYHAASYHLAQSILEEFQYNLNFISRGHKTANFQVLSQSIGYYPAILIETGFITHKDEALYFSRAHHIKALALAILMGLKTHLNITL
ncbi:N-acetylmuramoyl-L-alanine amidase [uncultured Formosa sp.]|uniref:N-acetylmuramoyl-L-alanine amidase family protein n=1 Tax=uncultured Formosa sp. TaxID=255435 RepID=UPI00262D68D7|nr:N-acetylmuramoyl-L-alanine amidase [uncultured Formosa sp.]